jgi:hypothetical protein
MTRRPIAEVRILEQPHLHPEAVRVEIECRYSATGLTSIPGPMLALTRPQMITAAVFEHESLCGECDTEAAHQQGDQRVREQTDRDWEALLVAAQRRYDEGVRN